MAKRIYTVQVGDGNEGGGGLVQVTLDEDDVRAAWDIGDVYVPSFLATALRRAWSEFDPDQMQWKTFEAFQDDVHSVTLFFPDGLKIIGPVGGVQTR